MAKHSPEETKTEAPTVVALSSTDFAALIEAAAERAADRRLAAIMTAKSPDERIRDALERQRGIGVPTAQEFLVACLSPITGATFTARLIASKSLGERVVELLDYQRPEGWDRKRADGGIVEDGDQMPLVGQDGKPGKRYVKWLYEAFYMRDANEVGGKPLPPQWRAGYASAPGSVTLTPEQMSQLGINAEQLAAALAEPVPAAESADKAAE